MLEDIQTETNEALETLRNLARGIYPPLLAEKGLGVALEAQARRSALPVTVSSDAIGRYGQDAEAAVRLVFEVEDDGRGFDTHATALGSGLRGMADRIAAVGGELEVGSSPGAGTRIRGIMPVSGSSG